MKFHLLLPIIAVLYSYYLQKKVNFTLNLDEVLVTAADLLVMTDCVSEAIITAAP